MFENLHSIFSNVLKLAKEYESSQNEAYGGKAITMEDLFKEEKTPIEIKADNAEKVLTEYLETLDYDTIKILMTIMYLGRDRDFDDVEDNNERFKALYDALSHTFNDKEIDIDQMVSKVPFGSYLEQGFKILGISI